MKHKIKHDLNFYKETLLKNADRIKNKYQISKLGIFGSYADGEETDESDLDILVSFNDNYTDKLTLFFVGGVQYYLSDLLDINVDLVMADEMESKPELKEIILRQAKNII